MASVKVCRVNRHIPIAKTLSTLDDIVRSSRIRYLGSSNFDIRHLCEAEWVAHTYYFNRLFSIQNCYNLLKREVECETILCCEAYGVDTIPYFPFEYGKARSHSARPRYCRIGGSANSIFAHSQLGRP